MSACLCPFFKPVWTFLYDILEPIDPVPGPYPCTGPVPVQCDKTISITVMEGSVHQGIGSKVSNPGFSVPIPSQVHILENPMKFKSVWSVFEKNGIRPAHPH